MTVYCPKCAARIVGFPEPPHCEDTKSPLPAALYQSLTAYCVARTEEQGTDALSFQVGGRWYCPGCSAQIHERSGQLSCDYCGCSINRFVHSLVEHFIHPPERSQRHSVSNPLLKAAMYGYTEVARAISLRRPELRSSLSDTGHTPSELALAAGHIGTSVALARCGRPPGRLLPNPTHLLINLMRELSEASACANWLVDLEHLLWKSAARHQGLPEAQDPFGLSRLPNTVAEDLAWLSDLADGWVHWTVRGPEWLSIQEWTQQHEAWEAQR